MDKEKLLGLSNKDDSMQYKFSPLNETLQKIDLIFDIYDYLYTEDDKNIYSYKFQVKQGDLCFFRETKEFVVYFIFTKNAAHVILRKILNWKKYNNKILRSFEFHRKRLNK